MTTRQVPMMGIPLKHTEDVDLATPLRHYIRAHYGGGDKFREECTTISRLRQDMRGAGRDAVGRDLCYRYYGQLELLELRFQIDEDHIKVMFSWLDAFTDVETSQYSLAYEKASVLFNLAAVLSGIALQQQRATPEGMKLAYHSFQAAAGLLNFINDNFLHAPSTDLARETIKLLSTVMLAQAQEVFTEKQMRDSGKPAIVAKLCAETHALYHDAGELLAELVLAGNIDRHWAHYCAVKEKFFGALAHYYQAQSDEDKGKYGEAVARLEVASTLAKEAWQSAKSYSGDFGRYPHLSADPGPALVEVTKAHADLLAEKLTASKKENDVIYHEPVPKESALAAVPKLASAKPISLHDLYAGQDIGKVIGPDIFHKLVPMSVHESASVYTEEVAKMLRDEQEKSDVADSELLTALEYLGLPKALHQWKQSDDQLSRDLAGVPAALRNATDEVARQERSDPMATRFARVEAARDAVSAALARATKALDEEARQCEAMRNKFREVWTQRPSAEVVGSLRTDLSNFAGSLSAARASDDAMRQTYEPIKEELRELGSADAETILENLIITSRTGDSQATGGSGAAGNAASLLDLDDGPSAPAASAATEARDAVQVKVDQVDDLLRKLQVVKKERLATLADLKERGRSDDISDVLVLNKKNPGIERRVFQQELEKFRPHQVRLQATVSRQEQLLEEVQSTFGALLADKNQQRRIRDWESLRRRRDEKVDRLAAAASSHDDLTRGLARAEKFYNDLQPMAADAEAKAKAFVQARQNEGRDILKRRQANRAAAPGVSTAGFGAPIGGHGGGGMGVPPPVPMSPHATGAQNGGGAGAMSPGAASLRSQLEGLSMGSPLPPSNDQQRRY